MLWSGAGLNGLEPSDCRGRVAVGLRTRDVLRRRQPLTHAFDGFFVHSRGAAGSPWRPPASPTSRIDRGTPSIFRTDQSAPVMDVQSETDVTSILDSYAARQPDNDRFRLWEVVGTADADKHLLGSTARYVDCGVPINNGPMYLVAQAAYHDLTAWVAAGKPPPHAQPIQVTPGPWPQIVRDAEGIALGGVRTPPRGRPVEELSGAPGPNPSTICLLLGSSRPFSASQLGHLYPSRSVTMRDTTPTAKVIAAGFVLPAGQSGVAGLRLAALSVGVPQFMLSSTLPVQFALDSSARS